MAIFLLVGVSAIEWQATPAGAIGLQIVALVLCSLLTFTFVRKSPLAEASAVDTATNASIWRRTSLTFLAFETVILLRGRTSVVIAGMMIDTDTAGIYGAAERFAEVVTLGVVSINMFAAPHFASLHASGQKDELRRLVRGSQYLGLLFAIPVALALVVFGKPLLGLLSEGFVRGYSLLVVMLASVSIGALAGPAAYVLAMSGRERVTPAWRHAVYGRQPGPQLHAGNVLRSDGTRRDAPGDNGSLDRLHAVEPEEVPHQLKQIMPPGIQGAVPARSVRSPRGSPWKLRRVLWKPARRLHVG